MVIIKLALQSLANRKSTALLTLLGIAVSVTLLLGVERIRTQTKENFANTISGTDLIVGGRAGQVQLLLYSIFRIGNATNNISWESYQDIKNNKSVKWSVPLSLGDSHKGFRVLGTNQDYFRFYQYGKRQPLQFAQGKPFASPLEAVIGADVAKKLNYKVGQKIVVAHGGGEVSFAMHDNLPFTIVGVLAQTSTPVDRTVHVTLQGIEAIHVGWQDNETPLSAEQVDDVSLQPEVISAVLLGLKSRIHTFTLQRSINEYPQEPLLAIIPGVALQELWDTMGIAEQALLVISAFVVLSGLLGMLTSILTSLNERRREMAILRSVGARAVHVFGLLVAEAGILALLGALLGVCLLYIILAIAQPLLIAHYGVHIALAALTSYELSLLAIVVVAGFIIGVLPAWRAYRLSLSDGMTIRV
ncbi:MAG: ABC transporter permease [Alteromonadales bacterium]|nr:ABC transporter permease [Alteromonadales bacterium]